MIYEISRESDTSSSCSECRRNQNGQSHSKHVVQSSEEEKQSRVSMQYRDGKSLLKDKFHYDNNLLLILEQEIRQLKAKNQLQDKQIKQLKRYGMMGNKHQYDISKSVKQIQHLKNQVSSLPKHQIGRVFSPNFKSKIVIEQQQSLKIALLQKQICELQLQLVQLRSKLSSCQQTIGWMQVFIESFVKMGEQLSNRYGQRIVLKGMNLRKKTKTSWKYIKQLINCLIK